QPLLGIHQFGFARQNAEELGVEQIDIVENRPRPDIARVDGCAGLVRYLQVLDSKMRNRLDACELIAPELANTLRARKPSGHADDGDAFSSGGVSLLFNHVVLPIRRSR